MYKDPKEMKKRDLIDRTKVTRDFADQQRNYQKRKSYIFGIGTLREHDGVKFPYLEICVMLELQDEIYTISKGTSRRIQL